MRGASKKRQSISPPDPLFSHTAAGLDFMDLTYKNGFLTSVGSGIQITTRPGRLRKLLIDATAGPSLFWFRGVEVPTQITTATHGTLVVPPTRGVTLLPLIAAPGVLWALDLEAGLMLGEVVSTDAILGLLAELKLENGVLCGPTGTSISKTRCLGMLNRFGVLVKPRINTRDALDLMAQLGISPGGPSGPITRLQQRIGGSAHRLDRCVCILEQRGYRVRLNGRLTSVCRPMGITFESTETSPWRLIPPADHSIDYAVAA